MHILQSTVNSSTFYMTPNVHMFTFLFARDYHLFIHLFALTPSPLRGSAEQYVPVTINSHSLSKDIWYFSEQAADRSLISFILNITTGLTFHCWIIKGFFLSCFVVCLYLRKKKLLMLVKLDTLCKRLRDSNQKRLKKKNCMLTLTFFFYFLSPILETKTKRMI